MNQPVLSRHRLPRAYRLSLAGLWLAPVALFLAAFTFGGLKLGGVDLRLLIPLAVMAFPALYVWREGIDVLPEGLLMRLHWPRYYGFDVLDNWYIDMRPNHRRLTIWNNQNRKVLECHPAHLSDVSTLLRTLKTHLRYRHWPE
jgi:hypothetical protein